MVRDVHHTHTNTISMISSIFYRDSLYITCDRSPSLLQRQAISFCSIVLSAFLLYPLLISGRRASILTLSKKYSLSLSLCAASSASVEYVPPGTQNERDSQGVGPCRAKPSRGRSQQDIREAYFFLKDEGWISSKDQLDIWSSDPAEESSIAAGSRHCEGMVMA